MNFATPLYVVFLEQMGGISIVDPIRFGSWWGDGSSRDPRHLADVGAADFTRQSLDMPEFRDALEAALSEPTPAAP